MLSCICSRASGAFAENGGSLALAALGLFVDLADVLVQVADLREPLGASVRLLVGTGERLFTCVDPDVVVEVMLLFKALLASFIAALQVLYLPLCLGVQVLVNREAGLRGQLLQVLVAARCPHLLQECFTRDDPDVVSRDWDTFEYFWIFYLIPM